MRVAFLSGSEIHLLGPDEAPCTFGSQFGSRYQDRALEIHRKNAWKLQGMGAMFQAGGVPIDSAAFETVANNIDITDLVRDRDTGVLLYALRAERVAGIFRLDPETGREDRLYHGHEGRVTSLAPRPGDSGEIACSLAAADGTANLALLDTVEGGLREITEGDSVDEAPSWRAGAENELLYQSAGVARDANGLVVATGPRSIHRLDLETGAVEELVGSPEHDLLCPQMTADGTLYCLRRPWSRRSLASPWEILRGILLFPLHFVTMVFHIVNNYTRWYTKRPMLKAGPVEREMPRQLQIWGQHIDLAKRPHAHANDESALVGNDWELVRRSTVDQPFEVVARGVMAYDLTSAGEVVWTNGRAIWTLDEGNDRRKVGRGAQVTRLAALG